MALLRLIRIALVAWRFGLDDIIAALLPAWMRRVRFALLGWRRHSEPGPVRLLRALEHLGPIFVKFGQVLSTRRDLLPADYADELAKLQDKVPPEPPEKIRAALERALERPLSEVFSEFDDSPAGSASVAQVHRAVLRDGREAAVKILRPGVRGRIRRDLRLMQTFAAAVEAIVPDGRRLRPRAVVAQFSKHLDEETDLLREAANCAQLRRNFADAPDVRVPEVYWEHCARGAMVMEFLEGVPVSHLDALRASGVDAKALARRGIELFFTQVFRDNFFHADMHPGNVHVDAEGRFVLLDFGIAGRLSEFDKEYLARNFLAFFNRDYRRVAEMHVEAGWTPPDTPLDEFEGEIRAVCEPIFAKPLREISFGKFLLNMFRAARRFRLEVQPQLVLLQKTLLNVEGMGRELDPDINLWETAKPFLEKWAERQYGPRHAWRILRRQTPDWMAVARELPPLAREMIRRAKAKGARDAEFERVRKSRGRWRAAAVVLIVVWLAAVLSAV